MGMFKFGGFSKASLFGGRGHGRSKDDRDHDRDDDDRHGHGHGNGHGHGHGHQAGGCGTGGNTGGVNGGGAANGNNFADIPNDTTGVTFTIDVGRDGTDDDYFVVKAPEGVDPATLTMQSYYDTVAADIAAKYPDTPPGQLVVKATIYSASQGESYQYFKGTETTTAQQNGANDDDDEADDHHGGGRHGGEHHGGWGKAKWFNKHDRNDDRDDRDDNDASCDRDKSDDKGHGGHDYAAFFANLMAPGVAPSEDDHGGTDDEDEKNDAEDLVFC